VRVALLPLALGSASAIAGEEAPKAKYVGVMGCAKLCHKTASQGKQLPIWQATWKPDRFTTKDGKKVGFDYDQCPDGTLPACSCRTLEGCAPSAHPRPKETE
jgi:hypothetical protein